MAKNIHAFADGAMFKHGNMGQDIYLDAARDSLWHHFGLASNDEIVSGIDHSPGLPAGGGQAARRRLALTAKNKSVRR